MIKALNTAATGMQAQQTNMDVIANNISNVNTTGFKQSRAEFEDLMYQTQKEPGSVVGENTNTPTGVQVGLGVKTASVQKDFKIGSAKITNNPFDMQIEGDGLFMVQLPDGQIGYTRDGSFRKSADGRVVDKNGHALLPEITIPPNAIGVDISGDGQVSVSIAAGQAPENVGQIEIVNFVNPTGLRANGKNVFLPTLASGQPNQGVPGTNGLGGIAQGQLEGSNVNIVESMVDMIGAQRGFETNSKVISAADQMLQTVNNLR
ncbi:MAG: flagellar basal-body rod protein FlgG [Bdellovibrionales bacterium CG10_big_fil_rev_8_21_14_0_10_45_34]|nr:MAG: flagellar basal-body rod protein FlgG [Bdellovibrionales bacterium CG10_big_fil_rev_8_21_14_0_10_45_34]